MARNFTATYSGAWWEDDFEDDFRSMGKQRPERFGEEARRGQKSRRPQQQKPRSRRYAARPAR